MLYSALKPHFVVAQISDAARLRAAGLDTQLMARRATEAYLMQVLKHGFLHSGAPTRRAHHYGSVILS